MRYDALKDFNDEEFRRLTGVMRTTFEKMVNILKEEEVKKKAAGGKPNNLEMEDRVLMALEYSKSNSIWCDNMIQYQEKCQQVHIVTI